MSYVGLRNLCNVQGIPIPLDDAQWIIYCYQLPHFAQVDKAIENKFLDQVHKLVGDGGA